MFIQQNNIQQKQKHRLHHLLPPRPATMDAERSWLGSLNTPYVKMSSPLTLDKPTTVNELDILLKRELRDCVIDESHDSANGTSRSPLFKIFPKVRLAISYSNLRISTYRDLQR